MTITFNYLPQLAAFCAKIVPHGVTFEVKEDQHGRWVLTFTGGY